MSPIATDGRAISLASLLVQAPKKALKKAPKKALEKPSRAYSSPPCSRSSKKPAPRPTSTSVKSKIEVLKISPPIVCCLSPKKVFFVF